MANVKDLKVGQKVLYRGASGELMTVDQPTGNVVFRYDAPREQAVSADGVRKVTPADITVHAGEIEPRPARSNRPE